jgi:uncharacterized protein (TIGR03382 family)
MIANTYSRTLRRRLYNWWIRNWAYNADKMGLGSALAFVLVVLLAALFFRR